MNLLEGIKVLDLSRILAGPWATQLLADYGAEVWKVEKPEKGDDTRHWGPPYAEVNGEQLSAYFMAANRGKQSVTIDFTTSQGQAQIRALAKQADILVENYKVGGLAQYGLDYESLAKINPSLIYCSITGFGQTGPQADLPGYDAIVQASAGLMSITGEADSEGGQPTKVGVAVSDLMTGMYASSAILAALNYRHLTGEGQHIDLSLFDCQVAMLANQGMNYLATGKSPERLGNAHPNIVPYQTFKCQDKHLMLAVGSDQQFARLCELMSLEKIKQDPKYATNQGRVLHREQLIPVLASQFKTASCASWLEKLNQAKISCGPVNNLGEVFNSQQVAARDMLVDMGEASSVQLTANPVKFSSQPALNYQAPPGLGEHTKTVLATFGSKKAL